MALLLVNVRSGPIPLFFETPDVWILLILPIIFRKRTRVVIRFSLFLQICRLQQHLSAGEHQQDLFQHQRPMFVSPHSQPPCNSLTELIQLCGGTVCRSVRQAGIFIGQYNGKKTEGSCSLSEQWILGKMAN